MRSTCLCQKPDKVAAVDIAVATGLVRAHKAQCYPSPPPCESTILETLELPVPRLFTLRKVVVLLLPPSSCSFNHQEDTWRGARSGACFGIQCGLRSQRESNSGMTKRVKREYCYMRTAEKVALVVCEDLKRLLALACQIYA